jgi:hypothetical protein
VDIQLEDEEECEGRYPKQFPVLMDLPEKEEAL